MKLILLPKTSYLTFFLFFNQMAPKKSTERSRDYRKKMKEDPVKYQQYIDREKERYKTRKETGKLKVISQLSKREQRNANNGELTKTIKEPMTKFDRKYNTMQLQTPPQDLQTCPQDHQCNKVRTVKMKIVKLLAEEAVRKLRQIKQKSIVIYLLSKRNYKWHRKKWKNTKRDALGFLGSFQN